MRTVDIGICHDDNFIVTELCDIEVVAVTLGKAAAECIDHGFDLGICQNFINRSLLYVQNLTADRQNCLEITVTRRLCGTARRISLDDKDLAQRRVLFLAVCQFAVRIKRIFLLGQHIRLGFSSLLRILADRSAQARTFFSTSRLRSKYSGISSPVTFPAAFAASGLSSFVLSGPRTADPGA